HMQGNTPVFQEIDLAEDVTNSTIIIEKAFKPKELVFQVFRSEFKSPTFYKQVAGNVTAKHPDGSVAFLTAPQMSYLARLAMHGNNDNIVTYIHDSVPRKMSVSTSYPVHFLVRNEGWNELNQANVELVLTFVETSERSVFTTME